MYSSNRRILGILFVIIGLVFGLSACGSGSEPAESSSENVVEVETPVNLNGEWAAESFEATISDDLIEIYLVDEATDTRGLYWKGTFPEPVDGKTISEADQEALDGSLLGSTADTKSFVIVVDTVQFEFTMMGVTSWTALERK